MANHLVIFDLDGTLCNTFDVDDECFRMVATEMLGVSFGPSSWEGSPHITDSGILGWLWSRYRGRAPTDQEIGSFVAAYEAALARELQCAPDRFTATAGAVQILRRVQEVGWDLAVATGGWGATARLKLRASGLPLELLLACSDDSHDRTNIFKLAHTRAAAVRGASYYSRTVLVGDGIWDIRVARALGWPFLGIGSGERAERLRREGAGVVVEDFTDSKAVVQHLLACAVPQAPARLVENPSAG